MSITNTTFKTYINTILIEAANNRGYAVDDNQSKPNDPTLRPYNGYSSIAAFAAFSSTVATLTTSETHKPSHEDPKAKQQNRFKFYTSCITFLFNTSVALVFREQLKNASETLIKTQEYQQLALILKNQHTNLRKHKDNLITQVSEKIFNLLDKVHVLDSMRKDKINNYSNFFPISGVGSVLLAVGIYADARWIKTAGTAILVASALLFSYTLVKHWGDEQKISDQYEKIGKSCEKIRYILRYYDENMKLKFDAIEKYQPLITKFVTEKYKPKAPTQEEFSKIVYVEFPSKTK